MLHTDAGKPISAPWAVQMPPSLSPLLQFIDSTIKTATVTFVSFTIYIIPIKEQS
jgi:hypothetical protein